MSALLRLLGLQLRGRVFRLARQLRRPKQLLGFLIGMAWVGFWVLRWAAGGDLREVMFRGWHGSLAGEPGAAVHLALALVLAAGVTVKWLLPWGRLGLPLKEAELHLLLPAPVSRRRIIRYALLKAQAPILISSVVIGVFGGTGRPGDLIRVLLAVWLLLTFWELSNKGRALFRLRQRELPPPAARRRRVVLVVGLAAFWTVLLVDLVPLGKQLMVEISAGGRDTATAFNAVAALLAERGRSGFLTWLLLPFRWAAAPFVAQDMASFLLALLPAGVMLVLFEEAVVRSRASFEEVALQHARSEAAKKSPFRRYLRLSGSMRGRAPFTLAEHGGPVTAIVWKNLVSVTRFPAAWLGGLALAVLALLIIVPAVAGAPNGLFVVVEVAGLGLVAWSAFAALGLRNNLRGDLGHLELVRPWPVSSQRLVLAEVLSSASVSAALGTFGAALTAAALAGERLAARLSEAGSTSWFLLPQGAVVLGVPAPLVLLLGLAGAVALVAGIAAVSSALQNVAVLVFPGWIAHGPTSSRGMAATGQNLLLGSAMSIALAVALLPSLLLLGLVALAHWILDLPLVAWTLPFLGVLMAAPLVVETLFLVAIAAKLWSDLDPSQEVLEGGG